MSAVEASPVVEELVLQLANDEGPMAVEGQSNTRRLSSTQDHPNAQEHANAQHSPSTQDPPNTQDPVDARDSEGAQDLSNIQDSSNIQNPSSTQQPPVNQDAPNTQDLPDAQDLPDIQEAPGTQGFSSIRNLLSIQELPINQDLLNTQDPPEIQDTQGNQELSNTQDTSNIQGSSNIQSLSSSQDLPIDQDLSNTQDPPNNQEVPEIQVAQGTQDLSKTQDLPIAQDASGTQDLPDVQSLLGTQEPPIEQDLPNIKTLSNTGIVPNIPNTPGPEELVERLTNDRNKAPNVQDASKTPDLPNTEGILDANESPNIQKLSHDSENRNAGQLPHLPETPSIEELVVQGLANFEESTTTQSSINDEKSSAVSKRQRSEEGIEETEVAEEIDARRSKRHKSSKKECQNDKKAKSKAKIKTKSKCTIRKKEKNKGVDKLFTCNVITVEMPTEDDFERPYGPSRTSYTWGPPKYRKVKTRPSFAPPPQIPSAGDDSGGALRTDSRSHSSHKRNHEPKRNNEPERNDELRGRTERDMELDMGLDMEMDIELKYVFKFLRLPAEIREEVYRYLLVSPKPVMVRAGWMRMYEREKPGLNTEILRVNQQINTEAVRILYSENVFLYRLRDPRNTGSGVADIQGLAEDDDRSEVDTDYENSQDFDYEVAPAGRRSSRKKTVPKMDINVAKFGLLFRRLTIQAEYNRYDQNVMQSMAQAISVFTAQPGNGTKAYKDSAKDGKPRATNIHTFTVRVAPMSTSDSFTFVDFFKSDSPVNEALKRLSCQFIHIELLAQHLDPTTRHTGLRMVIDMRYRRIHRRAGRGNTPGQKDIWHNDPCIIDTRRMRVRESFRALMTLEQKVFDWCCKSSSAYIGEEDEYWADGFWFEDEYVEDDA